MMVRNVRSKDTVLFNDTDIEEILSSIQEFATLVKSDNTPAHDEIVNARINFNMLLNKIETKLCSHEVQLARNIEHFNQNDSLKCLTLKEITGQAWPVE